jgi:hypothetical protein
LALQKLEINLCVNGVLTVKETDLPQRNKTIANEEDAVSGTKMRQK